MGIAFRGAGALASGMGSCSVPWPGSQVNGDTAILYVITDPSDTASPPGGWNAMVGGESSRGAGGFPEKGSLFYRTVGSSESNITVTAARGLGAWIVVLSGGIGALTPLPSVVTSDTMNLWTATGFTLSPVGSFAVGFLTAMCSNDGIPEVPTDAASYNGYLTSVSFKTNDTYPDQNYSSTARRCVAMVGTLTTEGADGLTSQTAHNHPGHNTFLVLATPVVIAPSGLASGGAHGSTAVVEVLAPSGIASAGAIGSPAVVAVIAPTGVASSGAIGAATVLAGAFIDPVGLTSSEAIGTHIVTSTRTAASPAIKRSGRVAMSSVLLLHFDEADGVAPSDATENLEDLAIWGYDGDIDEPPEADTWAGRGRTFDGIDTALVAVDNPDGNTLLQRDLTIMAILSVTVSNNNTMCVVARGCSTSGVVSPAISWGLELQQQADFAGYLEARLFWSNTAGAKKTQPAGVFKHPGDGKEFLLTATRRWESSTRVVTRYYVDDEQIAEVATVDGDVAGNTTYPLSLGGELNAGTWRNFFKGTLDELAVLDFEMCPEEVRQVWKRLTEYQPGGVETLAELMPPGLDALAKDAGTNEGKRVKIAGEALGLAVAQVEELRELWLPDRAVLETITRWEKLRGLSPKPRDSLDTRRARVLAMCAREQGYSIPAVQIALSTLFDQEADDVELIEFTNEMTDGFATLDNQRWLEGTVGDWSAAAGELVLHCDAGDDLDWAVSQYPTHLRSVLDRGDDNVFVAVTITDWGTLPTNAGVGLYIHDRRVHDLFWFGVWFNGATYKIAYRQVLAGVETAVVEMTAAPGAGPLYLRAKTDHNPAAPRIKVSYSTDGVAWTDTLLAVGTAESDCDWGGIAAIASAANLSADIDATFDNFISWCPGSVLPFCWYAYRNPALAGAPDMIGAQLVVQKVKPAHTHAAAIGSKSLLADDPVYGLCDRGPVGGF